MCIEEKMYVCMGNVGRGDIIDKAVIGREVSSLGEEMKTHVAHGWRRDGRDKMGRSGEVGRGREWVG